MCIAKIVEQYPLEDCSRDDPPLRGPGSNARSSHRRSNFFVRLTDQIQLQHFFWVRFLSTTGGQRVERPYLGLVNNLLVAGCIEQFSRCNALKGADSRWLHASCFSAWPRSDSSLNGSFLACTTFPTWWPRGSSLDGSDHRPASPVRRTLQGKPWRGVCGCCFVVLMPSVSRAKIEVQMIWGQVSKHS